jgi:hypothetical protein
MGFWPGGINQTLSNFETRITFLKGRYEQPIFTQWPPGFILLLTGRQILRSEYYTGTDADLLVSVAGNEEDEQSHRPMNNAMIERCGSLIFKDNREQNIGVRRSLTLQ